MVLDGGPCSLWSQSELQNSECQGLVWVWLWLHGVEPACTVCLSACLSFFFYSLSFSV